MSTKRKGRLSSVVKKVAVALGIALLFSLLGIFSGLGYLSEVDIWRVDRNPYGFWWVHAHCNISYNPFLYSFSWLGGQGQHTNKSFLFLSVPTYVGGGMAMYPAWRSTAELEEEIALRLVLNQVLINIPFNFAILVMIELMKMRDLYICLFGGIMGFPIGGPIGAVVGLFAGVLAVVLVVPRLKPWLRILFLNRDLKKHRMFTVKNEEK